VKSSSRKDYREKKFSSSLVSAGEVVAARGRPGQSINRWGRTCSSEVALGRFVSGDRQRSKSAMTSSSSLLGDEEELRAAG
jgi:hypothetical protein